MLGIFQQTLTRFVFCFENNSIACQTICESGTRTELESRAFVLPPNSNSIQNQQEHMAILEEEASFLTSQHSALVYLSDFLNDFDISMQATAISQIESICLPHLGLNDFRRYGYFKLTFYRNGYIIHSYSPIKDTESFIKNALSDPKIQWLKKCSSSNPEIEYNHALPIQLLKGTSGFLFHEAVGHFLEIDNAISTQGNQKHSIVLGREILPKTITVTDNPLGKNDFCNYGQMDDLGNPFDPKPIVKKGRIESFLSALHDHHSRNPCNARRESYRHPVLPRMTNTEVDFEETKVTEANEYYIAIDEITFGFADIWNEIIHLFGSARLVKNDLTIGIIPQAHFSGSYRNLKSIQIISSERLLRPSFCKKSGQTVFVSTNSPEIEIEGFKTEGHCYVAQ